MSRQDVAMEIFGRIDDIDVLTGLAEAIADGDGKGDWIGPAFGADDAEEAIVDAAAAGKALLVFKQETNYPLEGVAQYCRENGIAYRLSTGPWGEDTLTDMEVWRPGMSNPRSLSLNGKEEITVNLADLRKAAAKGPDAVQALIDSHDIGRTRKGEKIDVSEDVLEIWKAELEADDPPMASMRA